MRSKTFGTKPIGMQMEGKWNNRDIMLRPSSSNGLTMAEKEEEGTVHSRKDRNNLFKNQRYQMPWFHLTLNMLEYL